MPVSKSLVPASNVILDSRQEEGEMMKFLSRLWNVQNIVLVLSWNNEMEESDRIKDWDST